MAPGVPVTSMNRRSFLGTAAAAGVLGLAGCSATGLSDSEYDVAMYSNKFEPQEYEVGVGDTVVWGNTGSRGHSVTAYDDEIPEEGTYFASGGFDSQAAAEDGWPGEGGIDSGETYEHTFEATGRYGYYCIPHEAAGMVGTIVVTE